MADATLHDCLTRMDALVRGAAPMLAGGAPFDLGRLRGSRIEMQRLLVDYQRCAHRDIVAPALTGITLRKAAIRDLKVACILLDQDFRSFADNWKMEHVARLWDEYRRAAEMGDRLRTHVERVRAAADAAGHRPFAPAYGAAA